MLANKSWQWPEWSPGVRGRARARAPEEQPGATCHMFTIKNSTNVQFELSLDCSGCPIQRTTNIQPGAKFDRCGPSCFWNSTCNTVTAQARHIGIPGQVEVGVPGLFPPGGLHSNEIHVALIGSKKTIELRENAAWNGLNRRYLLSSY
jgi:hypothetical protein